MRIFFPPQLVEFISTVLHLVYPEGVRFGFYEADFLLSPPGNAGDVSGSLGLSLYSVLPILVTTDRVSCF